MGGYWRKMEEIREVKGCLDQKLIRSSQMRKAVIYRKRKVRREAI
jgi:hypothetical protein